ncbi:SIMPL domain-containing protein [Niallia sp. 01092]|uniref:SIMPL domain-containing protein n=1 Tax=unclassified Niallia TaxID=2837522 RepID=UPI003FD3E3D7
MYYPPVRETNNPMKRSMTLFGNSILSLEPNIAVVQLGVVTMNVELKLAQQENARIIQQVIQSLLQLGIAQKDIQTIDYTIYPQYDYVDGKQQFKGYQVTHMLSVTIENMDQTGEVIDTAVQNGANRVSDIKFTVKNKDIYYKQALKTALEDAISKAKTLAKSMRVNLDPVPVKIIEKSTEPVPRPYKTVASSELVGGVSTTIEPGQITIEAKLEAEFYYFS